jgi:hypothetical protein
MKRRISAVLAVFFIFSIGVSSLNLNLWAASAQPVNYVKDINSIATVNTDTGELIISKWNGEAYFKIKTTDDPISYRLENEKNILEFEKYQARIYTIETKNQFQIFLISTSKQRD